jgi:hypothetical protein
LLPPQVARFGATVGAEQVGALLERAGWSK